MKCDFEILEKKFKEVELQKIMKTEEVRKLNKQKTAFDAQQKESEKLLIQEKAKVANLEKEFLKSKEELQSKNVLMDEFKLSTREIFFRYFIFLNSNLH